MTGVLPVALGRATRITPILVHSSKEYVCVMELHADVHERELREAFSYFTGTIYQRPPVRSNVRRALRKRRIHNIDFLERDGRLVLIKVLCDPGTYMRKLCHDIGIYLGVGAHMRELRRIRSGPFTEDKAVTLHKLSEAVYIWKNEGDDSLLRKYVLPVEVAACILPKIVLKDTAAATVAHGAQLGLSGIAAYTKDALKGSWAALVDLDGGLIGVGRLLVNLTEINPDSEEAKRVLSKQKIIVDSWEYPEYWRKKG